MFMKIKQDYGAFGIAFSEWLTAQFIKHYYALTYYYIGLL
jgi:hypothetical protein